MLQVNTLCTQSKSKFVTFHVVLVKNVQVITRNITRGNDRFHLLREKHF